MVAISVGNKNIVSLLEQVGFKKTKVDSVFSISWSYLPWNSNNIDTDKYCLIRKIISESYQSLIWIDPVNICDVENKLNKYLAHTNTTKNWYQLNEDSLGILSNVLSYGCWLMLFYDNKKNKVLPMELQDINDPIALINFLNSSKAMIGIISWHDDNEWLLGIGQTCNS